MVSQAGAMALAGLVPVCHSFACFLSTRPNEQIYNNATERSKVIYVGSLAGLVPGGPGHSHQSVRDISALGAVPGMALIEPFSRGRGRARRRHGPCTARRVRLHPALVSVPGRSASTRRRSRSCRPDAGPCSARPARSCFVAAGPVMVAAGWHAAELLAAEGSRPASSRSRGSATSTARGSPRSRAARQVVTLDNHYVTGGQGDAVLAALAAEEAPNRVHKVGVTSIPKSGGNDEVLKAHGLDAEGIAAQVRRRLGARVP